MSNKDNRVQQLETELAAAKESIEQRFNELAVLTRMLEESEQERNLLRSRLNKVQEALSWVESAPKPAPKQPATKAPAAKATTPAKQATPAAPAKAPTAQQAKAPEPLKVKLTKAERQKMVEFVSLVAESELFDAEWYLKSYRDVAAHERSAKNPAEHYVLYGGFEGRNPSQAFNSDYYLRNNSDVLKGKVNPLVHYLRFGQKEKRKARP